MIINYLPLNHERELSCYILQYLCIPNKQNLNSINNSNNNKIFFLVLK